MDIETKVTQIICEQLSVEESQVTPDASFQESLNADSLDIVERHHGPGGGFRHRNPG